MRARQWPVVLLLILTLATLAPAGPGDGPGKKPGPNHLIVHEWGTFTSFAGSDGVSLEFRTESRSDLPDFVFDRAKQYDLFARRFKAGDRSFSATKTRTYSTQRMETPVTYFYTDRPMTVNVSVGFPKGLLTEFYPPVREMMPVYIKDKPEAVGNSSLVWDNVQLIPPGQESAGQTPPAAAGQDHYAYARETDSALVRIADKFLGTAWCEKFLFYRGVGNFQMPVSVRAAEDGSFVVRVAGDEVIPAAFLVQVEGGTVRFKPLGEVRGEVAARPEDWRNGVEALASALTGAIEADGMYAKEAAAMVKTWRSSWIGEEGTRLLYLVPQRLTDRMIPLKVTPAPAEVRRTMVGRLELLTPEREKEVERLVIGLSSADVAERDAAGKALAGLGRFAEPSLARVSRMTDDAAVRARARALLEEMRRK